MRSYNRHWQRDYQLHSLTLRGLQLLPKFSHSMPNSSHGHDDSAAKIRSVCLLLWRRLDIYALEQLTWINSPTFQGFRVYPGETRLVVQGDTLRLAVTKGAKWFVVGFGSLFTPTFAVVTWLMIPHPERVLFSIGGTIVGILTFGFIYSMLSYHESLGDYLVVDCANKSITLPRLKKEFPLEGARLQWITGRTRTDSENHTDLNLIVKESSGDVRYHVMGGPRRKIIEQLVGLAELPIDEVILARNLSRDADACST